MYKTTLQKAVQLMSSVEGASEGNRDGVGFARGRDVRFDEIDVSQSGRGLGQARGRVCEGRI
jgi:hypothetical protein